jgi:hypothetical protein
MTRWTGAWITDLQFLVGVSSSPTPLPSSHLEGLGNRLEILLIGNIGLFWEFKVFDHLLLFRAKV